MKKTSIVIAAFAAFALAFVVLWQGATPVAQAQQKQVEITRVVPGDGRLQVDWTFSGDDSDLKDWLVFWRADSGINCCLILNETGIDKTARSFIIDRGPGGRKLENGVEHEISVHARGKGDSRHGASYATGTPRERAKPVITEVTAGKSRLEVSWTYDGAEIGLREWAIVWVPTSQDGILAGDIGRTSDVTSRSFVIENFRQHGALRNGVEYTIYVQPLFGNGIGKQSDKATGIPMPPLPDASPEITNVEPYDGVALIEWTFDADYGDSFADLIGWKVCHRAEGKDAVACDYTDDPGARFHMINELQNGKTYFVYAIPVFEEGREGSVSDDYQVSLPKLTLPGAPQDVRIEIKGNKYILHWSEPEDDGGTPIFAYLWRGGSQRRLAEVRNEDYRLDITRYLDNDGGVDRSRFYTFRVRAENSVGRGAVATYTLRPQYFPPVIDPEVGRSEYHHGLATVRWSAVDGAIKYRYNLRDVTSGNGWNGWKDVPDLLQASDPFECFWRGNNPGGHPGPTDCSSLIGAGKVGMNLDNLTPGRTYRIMVRAKTDEGVGPQSAKLKFVAGGRALQPQDLWAHHYTMTVESDDGETYIKRFVAFDWAKEYTGGPHDEGEYWQVRHNLSGNAGGWSRWITYAWITNGKGPLSGALLIRNTVPWTGDNFIIGTHLPFPEGSSFTPGVSMFQVRRGHVNLPALSAVSEVELKDGWRNNHQ